MSKLQAGAMVLGAMAISLAAGTVIALNGGARVEPTPKVKSKVELTTGKAILQDWKAKGSLGNMQRYVCRKIETTETGLAIGTIANMVASKSEATDSAEGEATKILIAGCLAKTDLENANLEEIFPAAAQPSAEKFKADQPDTLPSLPGAFRNVRILQIEPRTVTVVDPPSNVRSEPMSSQDGIDFNNVVAVHGAKTQLRITASADLPNGTWFYVPSDRGWIHSSQVR